MNGRSTAGRGSGPAPAALVPGSGLRDPREHSLSRGSGGFERVVALVLGSALLGVVLETWCSELLDRELVAATGFSWPTWGLAGAGLLAGLLGPKPGAVGPLLVLAGLTVLGGWVVAVRAQPTHSAVLLVGHWVAAFGGPLLATFWLSLLARLRGIDEAPTAEDALVTREEAGRWLLWVSFATLATSAPELTSTATATAEHAVRVGLVTALWLLAIATGSAFFVPARRERLRIRRRLNDIEAGRRPPWRIVSLDESVTRHGSLPRILRSIEPDALLVHQVDASPYREVHEEAIALVPRHNVELGRPPARWPTPTLLRWLTAAVAYCAPVVVIILVALGGRVVQLRWGPHFALVGLIALLTIPVWLPHALSRRLARDPNVPPQRIVGPEAFFAFLLGIVLPCLFFGAAAFDGID